MAKVIEVVTPQHPISVCERKLKRHREYSISQGQPRRFECTCGRAWQHYDDEAEGGAWVLVKPHPVIIDF